MSSHPLREALLNLLSAKLRSFLAVLGVLVGTASVVALMSSSQLATAHALSQFKQLGTNLLSIYIRDKNSVIKNNDESSGFQYVDIPKLLSASSQIETAAPYVVGFNNIDLDDMPLQGEMIGTTESFYTIAKLTLNHGRFISYLDRHDFFCVIGADIAKKIEETGKNPMHTQIRVGDFFFTIIGVLNKTPENLFIAANINQSIIIPLKTAFILNTHNHINTILIRLKQQPNIHAAESDIHSVMNKLLPNKTVIFNSPEQLIQLIAKSRQTYSLLLIAIGAISLVVGGIGVMNIMLVSVIERKREIGVRVAIGARQHDILRMFLIESMVLTVFGGLFGVACGTFISLLLAIFARWQFYFYFTPVFLGLSVSIAVGVLSGFYPAWRASRLDPIKILAGE